METQLVFRVRISRQPDGNKVVEQKLNLFFEMVRWELNLFFEREFRSGRIETTGFDIQKIRTDVCPIHIKSQL